MSNEHFNRAIYRLTTKVHKKNITTAIEFKTLKITGNNIKFSLINIHNYVINNYCSCLRLLVLLQLLVFDFLYGCIM